MALRQELKEQGANVLTLCPGGLSTNDEICAAISAQGIAGALTTNAMERVVRKTLDLAWKGRARYIPGAFNRFLFLLEKVFPASWTAALIFSALDTDAEKMALSHRNPVIGLSHSFFPATSRAI